MNTIVSPRRRRQTGIRTMKPLFNITPQLLVGVLMLAIGVVVLVTGTSASHAPDPSGASLASRFPHALPWYTLGGVMTGLVGLSLLLMSLLTRRK